MASLLLLGAGGHARVVAETALATGRFSRIAFLDDRCSEPAQLLDKFGWPVIGPLAATLEPQVRQQFSAALVAIWASPVFVDSCSGSLLINNTAF